MELKKLVLAQKLNHQKMQIQMLQELLRLVLIITGEVKIIFFKLLKKLVLKWRALIEEEALVDSGLMNCRDGKTLLKQLRQRLAAEPPAMGEL